MPQSKEQVLAKQRLIGRRNDRKRLQAIAADAGVALAVIDTGTTWAIYDAPQYAAAEDAGTPPPPPIIDIRRYEVAAMFLHGFVAGRTATTFAEVQAHHDAARKFEVSQTSRIGKP
jgi:hypothetical protein